ncbi:transcriptional regulator of acetoin/glycerol metabolism [Sedimentibacter acidaminivorans]|uniref:Transcriptional regulator of acetoin/glycerol metabolism n=1 Tax=Sedimentibacter acidaminivorans TaxID=913099 RepID=A0ABS4GEU8_9FIRM|nr:sigma 54-interacting transcriptional regulator [Sedimentibacter acidaminivorans]MBP1926223.1 transcriptional regulator of acetoin/glycerol metabolism [Sedimentibacter acidaminivorans]
MEEYKKFIEKSWKKFIETGDIDNGVRTEIAESWKRCKSYGVDPINKNVRPKYSVDADHKTYENEELISVARPIMENVYNIVRGSEFAIILTDKDGYIIEVIGDEDMLKKMDDLNFVKGELWTEKAVGTNAIGTALYINKAIQTIGADHYSITQHSWTCSASPIHDEEGNIIGCINMSGNYYNAHSHTLGIVTAAAHSIQKQLALTIANNLMNVTFNSTCEGMIALDEKLDIKKVNGKALEILNISFEDILNINIKETLRNVSFDKIITLDYKVYNNVECDFYIKNNRVRCIINAVPMKVNEKFVGVVITFRKTQDVHKLVSKVVGYKASYNFDDIITKNSKMKDMIEFAKKASKSDCNILIEGESGTGKELISQSIHNYSDRSSGPFVAINCASIPRELVESELFGYEKGAFTGASKEGHPGKFEIADEGTIFLDEIGELPLDMQTKLLRVLDNNKITRVGGTYEKQLNVRVIVATNRDLKEEIKKKNFRKDLYYRLSVMNIKTIPLNDRKEDIEILVKYFLKKLDIKNGQVGKKVSTYYINKLKEHNWSGNVRELRNVVERDYYLSDISLDLSNYIDEESFSGNDVEKAKINVVPMKSIEKEIIENALKKYNGNIVKTSQVLNIGRSTLYRKIKKYNIIVK